MMKRTAALHRLQTPSKRTMGPGLAAGAVVTWEVPDGSLAMYQVSHEARCHRQRSAVGNLGQPDPIAGSYRWYPGSEQARPEWSTNSTAMGTLMPIGELFESVLVETIHGPVKHVSRVPTGASRLPATTSAFSNIHVVEHAYCVGAAPGGLSLLGGIFA